MFKLILPNSPAIHAIQRPAPTPAARRPFSGLSRIFRPRTPTSPADLPPARTGEAIDQPTA